MIIGPSRIIHCPLCHGELRQWQMLSGNTFGGELWSDGYMYAPMMMEPILVTRCAHCTGIFWVEDAKESANSPRYDPLISEDELEPPERRDLPMIEWLDGDGIEEALRMVKEDDPPRKELHLLMKWMHAENRGQRSASTAPFQYGSHAIGPLEKAGRMERLQQLLGESDPDRLLKVYLLLNLQKPEEAQQELDLVTDPNYEEIKGKFKMVMAEKGPALFRVW
jgi:hypothetical protein